MRITHERTITAPATVVGGLLDRLGRPGDPLFPSPPWLPMQLDRPLSIGADGGHGPIRYWVSDYEPGRRVRFTFHPEAGLDGYHELAVEPRGRGRCVIRHTLDGSGRGWVRVVAPVVLRPLHDAVVEDMFDNAELAATGRVGTPARWSWWVRLLWHLTEIPRPRAVPVPDESEPVTSALERVDRADAWQVGRLAGTPADPKVWTDAIFADPPRWVRPMMRARDGAAPLVGIERGDRSAFETVSRTASEVVLGNDAAHLSVRVSVLVDGDAVTLTTVAMTHNRRGRGYLSVIWRAHPVIVRRMLHRAARRLALRASSAVVPLDV